MGERNLNKIYIIFLTIIWFIFSEKLTLEVFLFGFAASSFLTYINKPLIGKNKLIIKPGYYILLLKYFFILLILIIKANIQVAIIILNPNPKLDSEVIEYETKLLSDFNKMVLANSITLTPGTLTISLSDNLLKVHCLESKFKKGIFNSPFEKILLEIEEKYYD
jgi:multicomponent Na+:H+ antiporter subunit E